MSQGQDGQTNATPDEIEMREAAARDTVAAREALVEACRGINACIKRDRVVRNVRIGVMPTSRLANANTGEIPGVMVREGVCLVIEYGTPPPALGGPASWMAAPAQARAQAADKLIRLMALAMIDTQEQLRAMKEELQALKGQAPPLVTPPPGAGT